MSASMDAKTTDKITDSIETKSSLQICNSKEHPLPPKATSPTNLPGHSNNKRSFDVAFLAGSVGKKTNDESVLGKTCDGDTKSSPEKIYSTISNSNSPDIEVSLERSMPKSAFKKVGQQHTTLGGALKNDGKKDDKDIDFQTYIDQQSAINPVVNKVNRITENNNSPIKEKDDDLNYLIGPRGDITCLESRVSLSSHSENNDENKEHNQLQKNSLTNQRREKFSNQDKETEVKKRSKLKHPLHEGHSTTHSLPPPPLISSIPPTAFPLQQSNLSSSSLSETGSDIGPNLPTSPFNILQYPALKKFMDVHASQRKLTPHISAFSSIKPKHDEPHTPVSNNGLTPHSQPFSTAPTIMFPPTHPAPQFPPFPPSMGLASLIASPLLGPSPAAVVAAATSSRNGTAVGGSPGQNFVPSNTCAKCGVTFRMTSDLVYHMRTHHAKETSETSYEKRRHVDSLTCNVCGENFRERHHLTRHMTAHVARKGEPEEKSNITKTSSQSTKSSQSYMKQDVKGFGSIFPNLSNSDSSANERTTFKLL